MMFGSNDDARCPGFFGNAAPLPAIQFSGVEHICRFITMTPFFIGKGIRTEMCEKVKLRVMPLQLLWSRNRACSLSYANTRQAHADKCGKNDFSHMN